MSGPHTERALMLLVVLGAASCGDSGEDCPVGDPGCPCASGTCPAGLECVAEVCVFPAGTDTNPTTNADSEGTTAPSDESSGSPADPDAPSVLQVFADVERLEESGIMMITAQVTDPDGLADIVGGVLTDDATGVVYVPFTQISEGTFAAAINWDQVDAAVPIVFEFEGSRTYRASFVDLAAHEGSATIEIPFYCDPVVDEIHYDHWAVCGDGTCRVLDSASDCEGCDLACDTCLEAVCYASEFTPCLETTGAPISCDQVCEDIGAQCFEQGCDWIGKPFPEAAIVFGTLVLCEAMDASSSALCGESLDLPPGSAIQCCCGTAD